MTGRRLLLAAAAVVFLAGVAVLVKHLMAPAPTAPYVEMLDAPAPPSERKAERPRYEPTQSGGTFAGVVLGAGDVPVRDADVLLVGLDTGAKTVIETTSPSGETTTLDLPRFGEHRTIARQKTGPDGRFSLAAGSERALAIVAYERAYSPAMIAHTIEDPLEPGTDYVMRLSPAGRLDGQVLDRVTRNPVAGAEVAIFFQQPSNQGDRAGPIPSSPSHSFGVFADYVERVLGPLVWGIEPPPGDTGFRVRTSSDGRFSFGPVMKEVQVEVIVTHPEYMWTDNDEEVAFEVDQESFYRGKSSVPLTRKRRTVVPPGQTVEKTILLERGQEVKGRVVDAADKPIEGVAVSLEHVSQYRQHWWYRVKTRHAITDRDGRFRIAGLAQPPYNLQMTHPSFDTEWFSSVKAGSDEVYKIQAGGGWLDLRVEGGPPGVPRWTGRILLESPERTTTLRQEPVTVVDGKARVERVKPGTYAVTLTSGTSISSTVHAEVGAGPAVVTLSMESGGGVRIPVRDGAGKALDPAAVDLELLGAEGQPGRRAATLVSRAGLATSDGLIAGRYVATVS
jgi:hypothetical protein